MKKKEDVFYAVFTEKNRIFAMISAKFLPKALKLIVDIKVSKCKFLMNRAIFLVKNRIFISISGDTNSLSIPQSRLVNASTPPKIGKIDILSIPQLYW